VRTGTEPVDETGQDALAPIRISVVVDAPAERAFDVFTRDIGSWWPVATHSIERDRVTDIVMECREGGRILEVHADGTTARWGVISTWEPPARLRFSWNPTYEDRPDTEVEVMFVQLSDTQTRVELEHRHWERLGEAGVALRAQYSGGWIPVLDGYVRRVEG
jgi:uncharacterized protein YndB with AHSA1/START domain